MGSIYAELDSAKSDAITIAVQWIEALLTGSIASSVAVLAVASVGTLMLGGRLPLRRGISVIIGCFVLFSSSSIANALTSRIESRPEVTFIAQTPAPVIFAPPSQVESYDPYGGVAVPGPTAPSRELF